MDKALGLRNTMVDNVVLLVSRLLLAGIFVHEGVFLAANFSAASTAMAKVGVPALAVICTIALQLVAGIAIAVGWHARLGAAALGLFCVATAILFHNNFANRNELLHFEKDLAIAGGMFVLMLGGAGDFSLGGLASWRFGYDDGWHRLVRALNLGAIVRDDAIVSKKDRLADPQSRYIRDTPGDATA
jgi:putative oxidoreductase